MPLQFSTKAELEADLVSKPGIYATDIIVNTDNSLNGFSVSDLSVIKEVVEPDGTKRYVKATQSIVEDLSDNSFGYGNNKQWGEFDQTATTFKDEVRTQADSFEGSPYNGSTIISVIVNAVDESSQSAVCTAYLEDGSTTKALLYKRNGSWNTQIIN